jgi:hypothetical protein
MPRTGTPKYTLYLHATVNGKIGPTAFQFRDAEGNTVHTDKADVQSDRDRGRLIRKAARTLGVPEDTLRPQVEAECNRFIDDARRRQAEPPAAGAAEAGSVELLDAAPDVVRRPLCLVGGRAYAACWLHARTTVTQGVDEAGTTVTYDPPRVKDSHVLVIVRDDGQAFSDGPVPGAVPVAGLGVEVRLPCPLPPGKGWGGAGVKRFLAGGRPDVADVFRRLTLVVDKHIDFDRSLSDQGAMCDLVACYVLASWLLDAFDVVGYFWPNGDKGTGKTHFLAVLTELAYLGQLVLAGGSYASLRDLADYGACLAFDDAEGIMDVKRADPDKRALLLAGNRRGATVTVKELQGEQWVTRFIHTFCPRAFSAIRLPDDVLASRTITVPLVRSSDPDRARSEPLDHSCWPADRRRLLDDLWAVGLTALPELRTYDARAARESGMMGRELEPWRSIFAVALWLEERHGVAGLFGRMKALAVAYRSERGDLEAGDPVRVAVRALQGMAKAEGWVGEFTPKQLSEAMKAIAEEEDLADPDKPFTTPRRVGWLLNRLRVKKTDRDEKAKKRTVTRGELEALARAYGMTV